MRKAVKAIVSLLLVCLMLFGGSSMVFAVDNIGAEITKTAFPSFEDFVAKNGAAGALLYVPYIVFAGPIIFVFGAITAALIVGGVQGLDGIFKGIRT